MTNDANPAKDRLLRAAIAYVAQNGVADLSLRRLATEIGTSHRMLIYHFGSKEGLLIEVIHTVEEQQRATLAEFEVDPTLSPTEVARLMWQHLSDPSMWPAERLFFETYGQALQARTHTAGFLDDIVESWLPPAEAMRRQQGVPPRLAPAQARLDLAVTRGLLLDLLATGDRAATAAAVEQFSALFEAWRAVRPDRHGDAARTATHSVETDADPDAAFALIADPGRLREWAPGATDLELRCRANPDAYTIDYLRSIAPGVEGGAYLRVTPRPGGGSVVAMTLPVPRDAEVSAVVSILHDELAALARLLEHD